MLVSTFDSALSYFNDNSNFEITYKDVLKSQFGLKITLFIWYQFKSLI